MSALVEEALRRREVFRNAGKFLRLIKRTALNLDPRAQVYIFGSYARGEHVLSSDIDVLVLCKARPEEVMSAMWREGIREPFEIHAETPDRLRFYEKMSLKKI